VTFEGETERVEMSGKGEIVGPEKAAVGGVSVDAVRYRFNFPDDDPSDGADTMIFEELYAPAFGLTVEEVDHSFGTAIDDEDGTTYRYDDRETRRLISLQPS
jgi:hypothetical protein